MNIAIIPARGGSKRIAKKNIKLFHGKPIIAYAIECAQKSHLFDKVYVSTDDSEIEKVAMEFGASIHRRSAKNSDDLATTSEVLFEVINDLETKLGPVESICCIYPTSPLIQKEDLLVGFRTFQKNNCDVVLAALPFSFPPQRGFTIRNNHVTLVSPESIQKRSQDLEINYHDAGAFYFIKTPTFKKTQNLWEGVINAIILQETKAQDIDNEEDWKMAELKYQLLVADKNAGPLVEEWENKEYSCLKNQIFANDSFKLIPIRSNDRFDIMKWRNEQVYHLRQNGLLSLEQQNLYYQKTVFQLFDDRQPNQILFSFLKNDICIGYGGLVHINWIDKHAEISFVMNTALEKEFFSFYWSNYLKLIEKVAFEDLNFHKIFTYAFDIRPKLYDVLLENNFKEDARLKEHCFFENKYIDVVIHSKINSHLTFRKPTKQDAALYFEWANDEAVRNNSYHTASIDYQTHLNWFNSKIADDSCFMYLFQNELEENIGQVRIQKQNDTSAIIGVSVDSKQRGKGYSDKLIEIASDNFLTVNNNYTINAFIKEDNIASVKSFKKAGFDLKEILTYENVRSFHFTKNHQ